MQGCGRPRIHIHIKGLNVCLVALIDTGSTDTLINENVYNKLGSRTPLYKAPLVQSITNHYLPITGACIVNIFGQPIEVLVCKDLGVDVLLGANVCKSAVIDFSSKMFKINGKVFPMNVKVETVCPIMATSVVPQTTDTEINPVLMEYSDLFSHKETPVNVANLTPAVINTDSPPIKQRSYRLPYSKRRIVEDCIEQMLQDNIIRPSESPWCSPVVIVPKRDGTNRFCVDYRKLNAVTQKDAHPLPYIQDIFDQVQGARIFSSLDLKSGYWQVPMSEKSIPLTAFTCHLGLFEFVRMPFGLTNAPAIFQRAMNRVLSGLIGRICMVYIDDVIIFSRSVEEHVTHLRAVFDRFREAGLQLKPSKCNFALRKIELLGYEVSEAGISPLRKRVEAILDLKPPPDAKAVRSFLGMAGYYRTSVPNFAEVALPLTELTKPRQPFYWGPEQQRSFDKLKTALTQAPILAHPNPAKDYILYTDASNTCIGAILVQKDDEGVERVISYLSHKLSGAQLRWPIIEKEAYAIIYALKKFHAYLWAAKLEVHTDHKPLLSLFQGEVKNSKIMRWSVIIAQYGPRILYHKGALNIRADTLSRIASVSPAVPLELPVEVPDVWKTDGIDVKELQLNQQKQFSDEIIEANQGTDETRYVISNGLLYTMAEPYRHAGRYMRLLLPQQYRKKVIDRCHAEVAHSAMGKTLARIQEHYVWPGMRAIVKEYISKCVRCNTLTPPNPKMPRGVIPTPPAPFHTWGIDLVGPFKKDQRGRQFLLTCVCHLTGWAEAIPIASKRSAVVQEAFLTNVVGRYGIPSILISDNGGEFTSQEFANWLSEFGIEHRFTSPYHPQTNGLVERFNGTLQKILLKLSGGNERLWSKYLTEALYAYRITRGPFNLSPYQAVYGQRPRLPRAQVDGQEEGDRLRAIRIAERILIDARTEARAKYKNRESPRARQLPPGTFVSVQVLNPRKGQSRWAPGYQVVSSHDGALRVMELATGRIIRLNQQRVREIPQYQAYDEIDPIPNKQPTGSDLPPVEAKPVLDSTQQTPLNSAKLAAMQSRPATWQTWCNLVRQRCRNNN